ncbi:metal ABC transporter permease [Herpetosiphon geysericola]|uniref:ABC transporter n=1 Tax=Herpetosiphon geysericola TaxID=70996 RepID=A0A0N8GSU3_9CHLR|nr:metal ABC transporter permease [Herpetosiphon geysericola]KPL90258.1 ABC transporter [Herpetosiphon geysericola]
MNQLLEPLSFSFFRYGILAAVLIGSLCGLLGVYIVLRGMSYIGHGLSHAIFGGAVVSFVLAWNFYLGAGLWGFAAAVLINQTARRTKINADAAIGIVTTASFAIGVALISRYRNFTRSFDAALFGNILGVTNSDLWAIGGVCIMVGLVVFFSYKQLLFMTFNNDVAHVYGVRTNWLDTLFSLMLAATLIVSMKILGVTLIAAALVIPPITARLLTDSFHRMLGISTVIGGLTGCVGMYLSYFFDLASGATIVLTQTGCFMVALGIAALRKQLRSRMIHTHV